MNYTEENLKKDLEELNERLNNLEKILPDYLPEGAECE